ncbi:MAG: NAD(P)H-binding protein [Thermoplasmata archaeon]
MTDRGETVVVAGAAGFLGRAAVRAFVRRGHRVLGLVRRPAQAEAVRRDGAEPVVGDLLAPDSWEGSLAGASIVVHAAANPSDASGEDDPRIAAVRIAGGRSLARIAARRGARRLVVVSGYWVYPDAAETRTEEAPIDPVGEARTNRETELAVEAELRGTPVDHPVVRPGMVYGTGAWLPPIARALAGRRYAVIDGGQNPWSFVSRDDAGEAIATVGAAAGPVPPVLTVVDDRPVPWGTFVGSLARRLGLPPPRSVSRAEGIRLYGETIARQLSARRAFLAPRLRSLGWRPLDPSVEEGLARILGRAEAAGIDPLAGDLYDGEPIRSGNRPSDTAAKSAR